MADSAHDPAKPAPAPDSSSSESGTYKDASQQAGSPASKLKIGLFAAAGALAGGLAAAWYYRRTVSLLRSLPENPENSNFGIHPPHSASEHPSETDPDFD